MLMDQYFEQMAKYSQSSKFPPRIRFMLRDVIELRSDNWVPRKVTNVEGPMPMNQLQPDDDNLMRSPFVNRNHRQQQMMNDSEPHNWMNKMSSLSMQNSDWNGLGVTSSASHYSQPYNSSPGGGGGGGGNNYNNRDYRDGGGPGGGGGGGGHHHRGGGNNDHHGGGHRDGRDGRDGGYRHNNQRGGNGQMHNNYNNRYMNNNNNNNNGSMMMMNKHNSHNINSHNNYNSSSSSAASPASMLGKDLAPRFKRNLITPPQDPAENLSFRPAANSLLFKANINVKLPLSTQLPRPSSASNPTATSGGSSGTGTTGAAGGGGGSGATSGNTNNGISGGANLNNSLNNIGGSHSLLDSHHHHHLHRDQPIQTAMKMSSTMPPMVNNLLNNKDQILIKQASLEKPKQNKKDKGPNKEEVLKRVQTFLADNFLVGIKEETAAVTAVAAAVTEESTVEEEAVKIAAESTAAAVDNNGSSDGIIEKKVIIVDGDDDLAAVAVAVDQRRNIDDIVAAFLDLKVPDKYMRDTMTLILHEIVDRSDQVHERVFEFLVQLRKEMKFNPSSIVDGFRALVNGMDDSTVPRIATRVASLIARAVTTKLSKFSDVAAFTDNGQHYPLLLLVLQQMNRSIGKPALVELFNDSKVNLMNTLPETHRTKERMAEILADRNLSFLYPLLKLQGELQRQMANDPNPAHVFRWIMDNVEAACYTDPGFITALMTVLLKYITQESTLGAGVDPTQIPDKALLDKEKALLERYCPVLQKFLNDKRDLQLVAIFALQVFCHSVHFPKGMLLRWFRALYDLNVILEDSFLSWKEDLSDAYPGKGDALFQVNTYLTWLEQAESEDEDEDDD